MNGPLHLIHASFSLSPRDGGYFSEFYGSAISRQELKVRSIDSGVYTELLFLIKFSLQNTAKLLLTRLWALPVAGIAAPFGGKDAII